MTAYSKAQQLGTTPTEAALRGIALRRNRERLIALSVGIEGIRRAHFIEADPCDGELLCSALNATVAHLDLATSQLDRAIAANEGNADGKDAGSQQDDGALPQEGLREEEHEKDSPP